MMIGRCEIFLNGTPLGKSEFRVARRHVVPSGVWEWAFGHHLLDFRVRVTFETVDD